MSAPLDWDEAMAQAIDLAAAGPRGSNPQVGCVLLSPQGEVIGRGFHRGAGTAHAEVVALADAGERARGATAVVTLEPCRHTGRTGPCTEALIAAGVERVVIAVADPTAQAGGGAEVLRAAGVDVVMGVREVPARRVIRGWLALQDRGRPHITLKSAVSLDGRVADASGGPTPITGAAARARAHADRAVTDAVIVGTGTVLADDPALTARTPEGRLGDRQPLRVVVGRREIPQDARVQDSAARTLLVRDHDPHSLMAALVQAGVQEAIVEGGPTLAAALVEADVVDAVCWFVGPLVLGAGPLALPRLATQREIHVTGVSILGGDVLIEGDVLPVGS